MKSLILRSLTTRVAHTASVQDLAEAIDSICQLKGPIPRSASTLRAAVSALGPYLRKHVTDPSFWDGQLRLDVSGDYPVPTMSEVDRIAFWLLFEELSDVPPAASLVTPDGKRWKTEKEQVESLLEAQALHEKTECEKSPFVL